VLLQPRQLPHHLQLAAKRSEGEGTLIFALCLCVVHSRSCMFRSTNYAH
jgi:hypothetical protein